MVTPLAAAAALKLKPGNGIDCKLGWQMLQDFSTTSSYTHTFTAAGSYIIVVWASPRQGFPSSGATPIIGGAVTVE